MRSFVLRNRRDELEWPPPSDEQMTAWAALRVECEADITHRRHKVDDVIHFEVGDWWHLHEVDGDLVFVQGQRCDACPPAPARSGRGIVASVDRAAGTITVNGRPS